MLHHLLHGLPTLFHLHAVGCLVFWTDIMHYGHDYFSRRISAYAAYIATPKCKTGFDSQFCKFSFSIEP